MKPLGSQLPNTLKQRANQLRELNRHLFSILPAELHGHIQVAALNRSTLTLEADSPAWAAKARYIGNDIARRLSGKTGLTIKSVKLLVQPVNMWNKSTSHHPLPLSRHTSNRLQSLAKSIEHPALKRALLKLAGRNDR